MNFNYRMIAVFSAFLLGACGTTSFDGEPSSPAPELQATDNGAVWKNIESFGAVPAVDKARGDYACQNAFNSDGNTYEAVGYHPQALDLSGKPIVGGGFFCTRKK